MCIRDRCNGTVFVEFLKKLMHDAPRPVFLILDNVSFHKCQIVKEYVGSLDGRLKLFFLPGYSPELNPDEWCGRTSRTTSSVAPESDASPNYTDVPLALWSAWPSFRKSSADSSATLHWPTSECLESPLVQFLLGIPESS